MLTVNLRGQNPYTCSVFWKRNLQEIQCLHFVADAFKEMRRYISLQATRKILPDDFVSTGWDARRGWESPHVFYDKKIKDIYELFITKTLIADNKQTKIVDIEDFLQVFFARFCETFPNCDCSTWQNRKYKIFD